MSTGISCDFPGFHRLYDDDWIDVFFYPCRQAISKWLFFCFDFIDKIKSFLSLIIEFLSLHSVVGIVSRWLLYRLLRNSQQALVCCFHHMLSLITIMIDELSISI